MSDPAIRVEALSKLYRIGDRQERYKTLRDTFASALKVPFKAARLRPRNGNSGGPAGDSIWAVKDLTLEIERGDVAGIIGRNGAGKSTLLKILSRITEPTRGYAEIRGRVGSLLEVGTGFHPELTGRENIYLNGAILGMRREEINRKFDEIVAFSEVERFIDTPVKRYSSGMHMRLAFSVAAHLQTEILLIDEVLAVGDIAFQKKCLGKMEDVAAHGKTVMFVSHNLAAIKELCRTAIVLGNGKLEFQGPVVDGLSRYSQQFIDAEESVRSTGWGALQLGSCSSPVATSIIGAESFSVQASLEIRESFDSGLLFCKIRDAVGNPVVMQRVSCDELGAEGIAPGRYRVTVDFPPLWLAPGVYSVSFKFVGQKLNEENENHSSGHAVLDVTGKTNAKSRASLYPSVKWTLSETATLSEQDRWYVSEVPQSSLSKTSS